ncbi:MauE/DoxX family redox-associated membrane protein [Streptomyces sp. 6N223]|uniref:MauE/DoxX family redox-associated membrane protein n=1 Tax=Streptomyces sp. 6N223 TaxID=3457412 RepID=UPI003FD5E018
MDYLLLGCESLLIVTFLAAAAGKARPAGRRDFRRSLRDVGIPRRLVPAVSVAVVAAEALAALLMLAAPTAPWGPALSVALLAVLTGGVARVLYDGRTVACACFGRAVRPLGAVHLVRNAALLLVAAAALAMVPAAGPVRPEVLATSLPAGAVAALLVMGADDVAALFSSAPAATAAASARRPK